MDNETDSGRPCGDERQSKSNESLPDINTAPHRTAPHGTARQGTAGRLRRAVMNGGVPVHGRTASRQRLLLMGAANKRNMDEMGRQTIARSINQSIKPCISSIPLFQTAAMAAVAELLREARKTRSALSLVSALH